MAQKVTVELVDDLDGTEAAETVTFGLDGRMYQADLCESNAAKLRKALEKFVASARKSGPRFGPLRSAAVTDPNEVAALRAWARENGIEVAARGRIAQSVRDAYAAR
jgi:hypothetical protein